MSAVQMGIQWGHRLGLFALSLLLLAVVLELVRRGWLRERYALVWLAASMAGLVIGVFPQTIIWVSNVLRFQYLTVLFALFFFFIVGLVLAFTVVISHLYERNRLLTQEVALLSSALKELERRHDG